MEWVVAVGQCCWMVIVRLLKKLLQISEIVPCHIKTLNCPGINSKMGEEQVVKKEDELFEEERNPIANRTA